MPNNLLEQVPEIIAEGRQEAERTLAHFNRRNGASLQTREWVFPAAPMEPQGLPRDTRPGIQPNRLIHGDSLLAAAALLAGDARLPSLRGRIGLILIDPQLDAQTGAHGSSDGVASYLDMITPRLVLMRELLSQTGTIYIRLDGIAGSVAGTIVDELFRGRNPVHTFTDSVKQPSNSLLEAIILVSSDPHTIVADFFGGFGRTAVAAAQYGRRWIAVDGSHSACMSMRRQLSLHSAEPFVYQAIA
jgi:hypothetical protein